MDITIKPKWLRIKPPSKENYSQIINKVKKTLCTVCVEAQCPNQLECFHNGIATFLLLGPACTRHCSFCAVDKRSVAPPNLMEPDLIANAIHELDLLYCVLTMVTRDDLPDGGAFHICNSVAALRERCHSVKIELLISDLSGDWAALKSLLQLVPEVISHNMETVKRLYPRVRPQAIYSRSLALLGKVSQFGTSILAKSGLMLGLGETRQEVLETMDDLRETGCRLLTLGQYLAPSEKHYPVMRYVHPDEFEDYRLEALKKGFIGVASAPLVRSSYKAEELYNRVILSIKKALPLCQN